MSPFEKITQLNQLNQSMESIHLGDAFRLPCVATVVAVDGTPVAQRLLVTPDLTSAAVTALCARFLGVARHPLAWTLSLFIEDAVSSSKCQQSLQLLYHGHFGLLPSIALLTFWTVRLMRTACLWSWFHDDPHRS